MEPDALTAAVGWVADVLTGTVATSIAVLAVAAIGLMALTGRVPARRAAEVVIGCFILFAAPGISRGLLDVATQDHQAVAAIPPPAPAYTPTVPKPVPYDPYAGASVPTDRTNPGIIR